MRVLVFDDVMFARGDELSVAGLAIELYAHADDAVALCTGAEPPALVCMDYSMGGLHRSGDAAIRELRAAGYAGRIVAMSSDPSANSAMRAAGADHALPSKSELGAFLRAFVGASARADPAR